MGYKFDIKDMNTKQSVSCGDNFNSGYLKEKKNETE
jgi:hypothetical protein